MLTKTSSDKQKSPQRAKLWACVLCNQLAFPGLGTIIAGRRIGYAQAAVMVAGFVLFTGFMVWVIICVGSYLLSGTADEDALPEVRYRPYLWVGKVGLALCLIAWCWALFSSIAMMRRSQKAP